MGRRGHAARAVGGSGGMGAKGTETGTGGRNAWCMVSKKRTKKERDHYYERRMYDDADDKESNPTTKSGEIRWNKRGEGHKLGRLGTGCACVSECVHSPCEIRDRS